MATVPNLKQGAKRELKIKLICLEHIKDKIQDLKYKMTHIVNLKSDFTAEVQALENAVNAKIKALEDQLSDKTVNAAFFKFWQNTIEPNCSIALKEYRSAKAVLYRGVINAPGDAFVAKSRDDRKPKDSSYDAQELFDKILVKLKYTAIRSNSIFTTHSPSHAGGYGSTYVIIPVNGFNFTYTNQGDFTIGIRKLISSKKYDNVNTLILKAGGNPDSYDLKYNTDIDIPKVNEKFKNDPILSKLTVNDLIDVTDIKKRFEPSNKNLKKGIKNDVEILINGTYYAFKLRSYGDVLDTALGFEIYKNY